jgi:hypothetical protein
MDTVHFTLTEKGRDLIERALKAGDRVFHPKE